MVDQKLIDNFESNVDYDTKLSNFEGPLDLLLFLIKKAEIEIKDIFVSEVTTQYLKYIENLDEIGIEKASEYLGIAATILEIKSREVLPPVNFDDEEEEEDPGKLLQRRLEEYKLFKEQADKLKTQENVDSFYKAPDDSANDVRIVYNDFNLEGLIKAFTKLMAKVDLRETVKTTKKEIPKEVYTVRDKIEFIRNVLSQRENCSFYELFTDFTTRSEFITTFQAMLELLKLQVIAIEQNGVYEDITIYLKNSNGGSIDELGEIDEYN